LINVLPDIFDLLIVPTSCNSIKNMRNPSGEYLKTACAVLVSQSYESAQAYCTTNQMELFTIDSVETQAAISALTDSQASSGSVWVNGKSGGLCSVLKRTDITSSFLPSTADCGNSFYSYCGYKSMKNKKKLDMI
jgi:hypothetical protein